MTYNEATFSDFLKNPYKASYQGYKPSYMDCLSYTANLVNFKTFKGIMKDFLPLNELTIGELFSNILVLCIMISIPFGGFFVFGTLSYFLKYRLVNSNTRAKDVKKRKEELLNQ